MPITPEKMKSYPGGSIRSPEWLEIRRRILARANHRCEKCGVKNHQVIYRWGEGYWMHEFGAVINPEGRYCGRARLDEVPAGKFVMIVLTIAHLDQNTENNTWKNLAALCQRCHNILDAPFRRANAAKTRRAKLAVADLFEQKRLTK